jgi:hypothetical protein
MSRSAHGVPAKQDRGNSRSVAAQATAHRVAARHAGSGHGHPP